MSRSDQGESDPGDELNPYRSGTQDGEQREQGSHRSRALALSMVRAADAGAGLLLLLVTTRFLPAAQLGYWILLTSSVMFVQAVIQFRSSEAVFAFVPGLVGEQKHAAARHVLWRCLFGELTAGAVSALVLLVGLGWFAGAYFPDQLMPRTMWVAALLPLLRGLAEPLDAAIRATFTPIMSVLLGAIAVVLRVGALGIAIFMFADFQHMALAAGIASATILVVYALAIVYAFQSRDDRSTPDDEISTKSLAAFLGYSSVISTLNSVVSQADVLILGAFVSAPVVATYGLARRLVGVTDVILRPLNEAFFSRLSHAEAKGEFEAVIRSERRTAWRVSASAMVLLLIVAPLLPWLLGPQYESATAPFACLALSVWWFSGHWFRPALAVKERQALAMRFIAVSVVAFVLAAIPLTWAFGQIGMALSHLVRVFVWLIVGSFTVKQVLLVGRDSSPIESDSERNADVSSAN